MPAPSRLASHTEVHLTPQQFHEAMCAPDTVVIDVRNFNETVIGKFAPPTACLSDGDEVFSFHMNNLEHCSVNVVEVCRTL